MLPFGCFAVCRTKQIADTKRHNPLGKSRVRACIHYEEAATDSSLCDCLFPVCCTFSNVAVARCCTSIILDCASRCNTASGVLGLPASAFLMEFDRSFPRVARSVGGAVGFAARVA